MNLVAAVDQNWAIGMKNRLLVRIPEDMDGFRRRTVGKVIVMGRRTLEGFPGGQPLAQRTNIILTRKRNFKAKGAVIVHSIGELMADLAQYDSGDVYVVGGEQVFRQLLDACDTAYITKLDYSYQADAHFPDLDKNEEWEITAESGEHTYFSLEYKFVKYERKKAK